MMISKHYNKTLSLPLS